MCKIGNSNIIQIRTLIIQDVANYPVNEPEELLQNTEVMRSAMYVKEELEVNALVRILIFYTFTMTTFRYNNY